MHRVNAWREYWQLTDNLNRVPQLWFHRDPPVVCRSGPVWGSTLCRLVPDGATDSWASRSIKDSISSGDSFDTPREGLEGTSGSRTGSGSSAAVVVSMAAAAASGTAVKSAGTSMLRVSICRPGAAGELLWYLLHSSWANSPAFIPGGHRRIMVNATPTFTLLINSTVEIRRKSHSYGFSKCKVYVLGIEIHLYNNVYRNIYQRFAIRGHDPDVLTN